MRALLLGSLGALGLLLTMIGFYGAISYAVNQRRREIGIRMTLGAKPGDVRAFVVRDALVLVVTGIGIGLVLSLVATPALKSMLSALAPPIRSRSTRLRWFWR